MSLLFTFLIMLFAGILGGVVNYLSPANENSDAAVKLRSWRQCVILGFGATFLVPLFLEIAQSKLLDKMHVGMHFKSVSNIKKPDSLKRDTVLIKIISWDTVKTGVDTQLIAKLNQTLSKKESSSQKPISNTTVADDSLKKYLLYGSYCLLAASAGFKFINMLSTML